MQPNANQPMPPQMPPMQPPPMPTPAAAPVAGNGLGGEFIRYSRHPETGNWENATWRINQFGPGRPGVEFSDGRVFDVEASRVEHAMSNTAVSGYQAVPAATAPPAIPGTAVVQPDQVQPADAAASRQDKLDAFKRRLVHLDAMSKELFDLPLDVLLAMVLRNAHNEKLQGAGHMAVYGGIAQFVPDQATLNTWTDAYIAEIEHRRRAADDAEL